jgi:hypothetical protein
MSDTAPKDVVPISAAKDAVPPPRVSGRLVGRVAGGTRRVLFVLFGLVYLQELGRLVGWLFGLRSEVDLELADASVRVRTRVSVLGVRSRERDEVWPLGEIRRAGIEHTMGGAFVWAGGGAVVAGVALGAVLAFRGRVGFGGSLFLCALAFVALGLALDVGAYALAQRLATRERVRLELALGDGRRLVVAGVERSRARAFLDALARSLPRALHE